VNIGEPRFGLKTCQSACLLVTLLVVLAGMPSAIGGETLRGKVVGVLDGDTITVLDGYRRQHRIRLHQIDAPEKDQDYGTRAKQSLAELVFGREVSIESVARDHYDRIVGKVSLAGRDMNLEQVRRGMAWVYRRYGRDPEYLAAEESAHRNRAGLWSKPHPIPPWEFRHERNDAAQSPLNWRRWLRHLR